MLRWKTSITHLLLYFSFMPVISAHAQPKSIPNLPVHFLDGSSTTLPSFSQGKPIYLKFWASWCKACLQEMPALQTDYLRFGSQVQFLAVNIGVEDDRESILEVQKRFGLTVPMAVDNNGTLADAFDFIGTPYHVVLASDGRWLHKGFKVDDALERILQQLVKPNPEPSTQPIVKKSQADESLLDMSALKGKQLLFFTTPWCNWYLENTRPDVATRCLANQQLAVALKQKYPSLVLKGIVTPLWTDAQALADYRRDFKVNYPTILDANSDFFRQFKVTEFSTFVMVDDGKLIAAYTHDLNFNKLEEKLFEHAFLPNKVDAAH